MELGSGLGTSYPTALDIDDTLEVNAPNVGKTKARAEVANDLAAAILAIEAELGTSPSGTSTNVKTFLQNEHNTNGTHKSVTTDTLSASGQITSTLADGTAPLVVTSTTKVDNLNADTVRGYVINQDLETTDSPTFVTVNAALNGNADTASNSTLFNGMSLSPAYSHTVTNLVDTAYTSWTTGAGTGALLIFSISSTDTYPQGIIIVLDNYSGNIFAKNVSGITKTFTVYYRFIQDV